ncbi:hypothetical protein SLA_4688 [Streptomyces laurentii]|uniref:Serine/arginine repetitive matrix protein 2 n=1 Tax=Streptomyces laurentii TaxID=39478 RepID=A0A169NVN3_STRLU|nr:hypothetical protein SLA_4688 [Streptomyces laurentii]
MARNGGGAWWNDESQSWVSGPAPAGPPPVPEPAPGLVPRPAPGTGQGTGPVVPLPPLPPLPPEPPSYVPASPGSPEPPTPGPSRHVLVAAVAAAVLVAGGIGGWLLWGRDGGDSGRAGHGASAAPGASAPGSDSASASPSDSGSPSPSDSASADATPPIGYRIVEDEDGFTVAVPEGWSRTTAGGSVFFNAPDDSSLMQVFEIGEPGLTPYEALKTVSRDVAKNPDFEQISLEETGADEAELVYAYHRSEGRRQVVARAFVGDDAVRRIVLVGGPDTDWPKQREILDTALRYFKPTTS